MGMVSGLYESPWIHGVYEYVSLKSNRVFCLHEPGLWTSHTLETSNGDTREYAAFLRKCGYRFTSPKKAKALGFPVDALDDVAGVPGWTRHYYVDGSMTIKSDRYEQLQYGA